MEAPQDIFVQARNNTFNITFQVMPSQPKVTVINMLGHLIYQENLADTYNYVNLNHLEKGVYIMQVETKSSGLNQKIIIK